MKKTSILLLISIGSGLSGGTFGYLAAHTFSWWGIILAIINAVFVGIMSGIAAASITERIN